MTYPGGYTLVSRFGAVLAWLVVLGLENPSHGAPNIYNMDRLLSAPHPFAGSQTFPSASTLSTSTAVKAPELSGTTPELSGNTAELSDRSEEGASNIYDMDRLLSEPYPFADARPLEAAKVVPAFAPVIPSDLAPGSAGENPLSNTTTFARGDDSDIFEYGDDADEAQDVNDPLEPFNRLTFAFNEAVNEHLLRPVARGYNSVLPQVVRRVVSNLLNNASAPVTFANDFLQGEINRGIETAIRIIINTTVGFGGAIDVAKNLGFEAHEEDFGQTLAVWGIDEGFYIILPLLGPSNPRDGIGRLFVDPFFDPLGYYLHDRKLDTVAYSLTALKGLVTYAGIVNEIDQMRETSIDFYGALRSLYRQRREAEIKN